LAGEEKKPTAEAASGPLRKPEDAAEAAFDFDKWEGEAAPAVAPNTDEQLSPEQKVMQQRRRDRVADLVRKKERKASSNPNGKKGRRVAATSEPRKSNPRPGRRATTNKDKTRKNRDLRPDQHSPRPGYDKRDLKKSKKSSNSSSGSSSSSSGHEYDCEVRVTNLTKEQWFSDIFWMVSLLRIVIFHPPLSGLMCSPHIFVLFSIAVEYLTIICSSYPILLLSSNRYTPTRLNFPSSNMDGPPSTTSPSSPRMAIRMI